MPTHWAFRTLLFQAGNGMRKEPSTLGKGHFWPEVWRRRLLTSSPLEHAYLLFPLRGQRSNWLARNSEYRTACPYFLIVKDRARLTLRTDNSSDIFTSETLSICHSYGQKQKPTKTRDALAETIPRSAHAKCIAKTRLQDKSRP